MLSLCNYAKYSYAECQYADCVILLFFLSLRWVLLHSVRSVIRLSVVTQSVVVLSVVRVNVVAPPLATQKFEHNCWRSWNKSTFEGYQISAVLSSLLLFKSKTYVSAKNVVPWHFVYMSICLLDISSTWHFVRSSKEDFTYLTCDLYHETFETFLVL